jgi:heme-degrading monooxygenase HmoA
LVQDRRREDAIAHMERTGEVSSRAPGFLYRQILESPEDAALLTSLTAWQTEEQYAAFRASRPASNHADAASPFDRIAHEGFVVLSETGPGRAPGPRPPQA